MKEVKLNLINNRGYKWFDNGSLYVKGYAFIEDELYEDAKLLEKLSDFSKEEIISLTEKMEGVYSIVKKDEDSLFALVDHVRSFPLFYKYDENELVIYDSLSSDIIKNFEIDKESEMEYWGASYLLGDKTLFKNVYGIQAGHYLEADKDSVNTKEYWRFKYDNPLVKDENEALRIVTEGYENLFKRLVKYLNGRTAVIPLSGGHDSRMVAYYLKKFGHDNIIAFSYGDGKMNDSVYSKKAAEALGLKYYYIKYDSKTLKKEIVKNFDDYAVFAGNGVSAPRVQTWCAFKYLVENKIIDKNCVVLTGYGGGLCGHYATDFFMSKEKIKKTDLIAYINNTISVGIRKKYPEASKKLKEKIPQYYKLDKLPEILDRDSAIEIYEWIAAIENQGKGIQNANRIYEYYDIKWGLTFLEKEQFKVWSKIDNSLKYHEKLYKKMETKLYEGAIKDVPFSGSKETKTEKLNLPTSKIGRVFSRIFQPERWHYLNAGIPRLEYYKLLFIDRSGDILHYFSKRYINKIKK